MSGQNATKTNVTTAWLRTSPEAQKQQVDAALEFALEATLQERPKKPLVLVSKKLREFDAAVNGDWELRPECEAVFNRADADGSGMLNLTEIHAMRQSEEFANVVRMPPTKKE